MNKYFFVEYEWKVVEDLEVPSIFYERGFCEKSSKDALRFKITGLIEYKNSFFIIFPKGMTIPQSSKEKTYSTKLLLNVLEKYSSATILEGEETEWLGKNEASILFETAKWLIDDYTHNGLIHSTKRKELINSNGRIEWSKSIQKMAPILSNNNFYYLDLITSKNDIVKDQELTIIHSIVINSVFKDFGWLLGSNFSDYPEKNNFSLNYMIYIIKNALKNTNVDREIKLFKKILAFLNRKASSDVFNIYATAYFANVWEAMCAQMLNNDRSLHKNVPKPYWFFEKNKTYTSQLPDILISHEKKIIVFDAKYYQIKYGIDKLPGWSDIVKQLFYAMSLRKSTEKMYNAFLFPSSCNDGFEYLGYAAVESKEIEFGKVFAFSLDVQLVLTNYVNYHSDTYSTEIINNLILKIKSL